MSQPFEQEMGRSLRAAGAFAYKLVDGKYAARPGDHIVLFEGRGYVIEEKMVNTPTFPLSAWTAKQRAHAAEVEASGGQYWLVVNFRGQVANGRVGVTMAFRGRHLLSCDLARGSLNPRSTGLPLERVTGGWDVRPLLAVT